MSMPPIADLFPMAAASLADLGSNIDAFFHAAERMADRLTEIGWGSLIAALVLWLGMLLARAHAWSNALRCSYPGRVDEVRVAASFLAGAGINAISPARAGDAAKIVLAKQGVAGSSYAAIASSFAVLVPFDTTLGICVLIYALSLGLLPRPPELPNLPAFEISFWADHPQFLLFVLTALAIGAVVLFVVLSRHIDSFWQRVQQGVAIFRDPRRYLRQVAAWQGVGWICRFASFWLFLEAFGVGGSVANVFVVMSVQAIATALPFTPGGAGAQQALLVATLEGPTRGAVLAFSVGQQAAVAAWTVLLGLVSLALVFRIRGFRAVKREAEEAQRAATKPEPEPARTKG